MTQEDKQLLVEISIAAANHNLADLCHDIVAIYPLLFTDIEHRKVIESVIYFALHDADRAMLALKGCHSVTSEGLKLLFSHTEPSKRQTETLCRLIRGDKNARN